MSIFQPFDATTVDPTQGSGSFPIGRHLVVANHHELKATKDNSGGMLVYTLQIIDGPNKGTEAGYRLNLYNNSPKAVEIAFKQLSALCHVTGKLRIMDPSELYGIPFYIEVALQKGDNPNGYTEIVKVYDQNGNEPGKAPAAPAAPQPAPAAAQQPAAQPQGWAQPAPAPAGAAGGPAPWGGTPQPAANGAAAAPWGQR